MKTAMQAAAIQERLNRYFQRWNPDHEVGRKGDLILENKAIMAHYRWGLAENARLSTAFGYWTPEKAKQQAKLLSIKELRDLAKIR